MAFMSFCKPWRRKLQSHMFGFLRSERRRPSRSPYAQYCPGQVAGLLILDSNVGNKELADLWPNAQAPGFDPKHVVTDDCTLEQYLEASARLRRVFNFDVNSPEGLDRRNVKDLLPEIGAPKLIGPDGRGMWLTVVGHEPEAFAHESLKMIKLPRSLSMQFTNP